MAPENPPLCLLWLDDIVPYYRPSHMLRCSLHFPTGVTHEDEVDPSAPPRTLHLGSPNPNSRQGVKSGRDVQLERTLRSVQTGRCARAWGKVPSDNRMESSNCPPLCSCARPVLMRIDGLWLLRRLVLFCWADSSRPITGTTSTMMLIRSWRCFMLVLSFASLITFSLTPRL